MLDRLLTRAGRFAVRRRRAVLLVALAFAIVAGAVGGGVFARLGNAGFQDPAAPSSQALTMLADRFGTGEPDLVLVVTAKHGSVDDAAVVAAGAGLTRRLKAQPDVVDVGSYWSLGRPVALRSADGSRALVVARTNGGEDRRGEIGQTVIDDFQSSHDSAVTVEVGGLAAAYAQFNSTIKHDLTRAESFAIPITLVLLVLVFGSLVAASLPLLVGGLSIVGALLSLYVITLLTDVSIFAINLVTAMGLGLGIDYALFVVSRFREELAKGASPDDAVVRTVRTAGRTVVFSGLTVALALSAMLVFPLYFLRSFAYAGIAVVAVAMVGAVVVLPATLSLLGRRVDSLMILRRSATPTDKGAWARIARVVMRRPWPIAVVSVIVLLALGAPFLHVVWGQSDDRSLPTSATVRQTGDILRADFPGRETTALSVVLPDTPPSADSTYAAKLSLLPSVNRVEGPGGVWVAGRLVSPAANAARFTSRDGAGSWVSVVPTVDPFSDDAKRLVAGVRNVPAPGTAYVGGAAAEAVDTTRSLADRIPWALGIVAISTIVLLFLFTGSVIVPIKALVLNTLSLSATFGAMVWIFQDGHLSGLLDFTPTGVLDESIPILMFCIAFGLSMDYEVFLLSRIKEEYDRTGDNTLAVERGLQRTGPIITAAALLLSVVFIAFSTSGVTTIKLMGIGIALAILVDATLVRGFLVPAFMRLAGDWNWWAPAPLRRLHQRFGLGEGPDLLDAPAQDRADVVSAR